MCPAIKENDVRIIKCTLKKGQIQELVKLQYILGMPSTKKTPYIVTLALPLRPPSPSPLVVTKNYNDNWLSVEHPRPLLGVVTCHFT